MKLKYKIVISVIIIAIGFACSDIIEESIHNKTVNIITPADSTKTSNYTQTFWWNDVNGAYWYRLLIVYNKFDSMPEFRLDTTISKSRFSLTLKPGKYQWKVWALNGSSQSDSASVQTLWINAAGIEGQDINITSPADNFLSKSKDVTFKWERLAGAKEYVIKIDSNSNKIAEKTITTNLFLYTFKNDGRYTWTVHAKNNDTVSNSSDPRFITIDTTPPDTTGMLKTITPANGSNVTGTTQIISWGTVTDASYYTLYIFTDASGATSYDPAKYPVKVTKNNYSFTGKSGDSIFWTVTASDLAGNAKALGDIKSFKIP